METNPSGTRHKGKPKSNKYSQEHSFSYEDADYLLARTHYSRDRWNMHEHRSSQYVAGILKSIYWQVPLWEENGRSARELDEESLGDVA